MLSVCLITSLPSVALAHARLSQANPAPDTTAASPPEVRIWFTQELTLHGNDIVVTDASGNRVDNADAHVDQNDPDRKQLVASVPPLADGSYSVTWTSQSAEDGDSVTESYAFSVATAAAEDAVGFCPDDVGQS